MGALHREYHLNYDESGLKKAKALALENKKRYFEFQNDSAILNIGVNDYSIEDLRKLEKKINFDSLAASIRKIKKWNKYIGDDIKITMWAHALFDRGILTGQNNCFGGTLSYVDLDYIHDKK